MNMTPKNENCSTGQEPCSCETQAGPQPFPMHPGEDVVCCGSPVRPPSSTLERPGYRLWHFVEEFVETPAGPVPRVKTSLARPDILATALARMSSFRNDYKVEPGLYCVGRPGPDSAVLVSANYKLSFDALRKELSGLDAWILVLDTRGINVWCAAGKGLFCAPEVIRMVKLSGLEEVVRHRNIILPQLSATGVSARDVEKGCGFSVTWGPVRARDIRGFIRAGMKAEFPMRRVTFTFAERLLLVPVELFLLIKPTMWALLAIFVLSGLGVGFFSFNAAWLRGFMAVCALGAGIFAGAVLVPALLPWLPGRAFSLKGAIAGLLGGAGVVLAFWGRARGLEDLALVLFAGVVSSYLAMNFTGATPFTSPSGVEKEMRRAIPLQAAALLATILAWVGASFAG